MGNTYAKSYHTFLFPFLFNADGLTSRKVFLSRLRKEWVPDYLDSHATAEGSAYNAYHYFNQAAREAIYTTAYTDNAVVWNYRFDLERYVEKADGTWMTSEKDNTNPAVLTIKKTHRNDKGVPTGEFLKSLHVDGLRLKLFNSGIGLLMIELENYDETTTEKDVILINEFGRRVFMPFVEKYEGEDAYHCPLCADEVELSFKGQRIPEASGSISGVKLTQFTQTPLSPILSFLLSNEAYTVSTVKGDGNTTFIDPIVDDRMFTACIFVDEALPKAVSEWDAENKCYAFQEAAHKELSKDNIARRLYEMLFVDGDGLSCYDRRMLSEKLDKHIFSRWLEMGTVTGITDYSMITVTSFAPATVGPFLTEYVEMIALVLAQRASLLAFERAISQLVCQNSTTPVDVLHKRYLSFQSDLLLQEVTAQQQGIELYTMLRENLFVVDQQAQTNERVEALHSNETSENERKENLILFGLAALGLFETMDIIFSVVLVEQKWIGILSAIPIVAVIFVLYYRKYFFKKKQ